MIILLRKWSAENKQKTQRKWVVGTRKCSVGIGTQSLTYSGTTIHMAAARHPGGESAVCTLQSEHLGVCVCVFLQRHESRIAHEWCLSRYDKKLCCVIILVWAGIFDCRATDTISAHSLIATLTLLHLAASSGAQPHINPRNQKLFGCEQPRHCRVTYAVNYYECSGFAYFD